jgi:hypothetical protein
MMHEQDEIKDLAKTTRIGMMLEIKTVLRELQAIKKKVDGFFLEDAICIDTAEALEDLDGYIDELKMTLPAAIQAAEDALEPFKEAR